MRHGFLLSSLTFQKPLSSSSTPNTIHPSHLLLISNLNRKFKQANEFQSEASYSVLWLVDLSRRAGMFILGLWHFLFESQTCTEFWHWTGSLEIRLMSQFSWLWKTWLEGHWIKPGKNAMNTRWHVPFKSITNTFSVTNKYPTFWNNVYCLIKKGKHV